MKRFAYLLLLLGAFRGFISGLHQRDSIKFNNVNYLGRVQFHFNSPGTDEFNFYGDEEFSGKSSLESTKSFIKNYKLKVKNDPSERKISIDFDASVPWNEKYLQENSVELKILKESFAKYFEDVFKKMNKKEIKLKVNNVKVHPVKSRDYVHFSIGADCLNSKKNAFDNLMECAVVIKKVVENLSPTELLIYFHEIGYSELVNPGLEST